MSQLKLGIPKGSLEQATIDLFGQAGWNISTHHRNYFPTINDPEIECALVRSQEMAKYVEGGTLDCGLTGIDWVLENEATVETICPLVYSKSTDQPARWVLVAKPDSGIKGIKDLQGKVVATELVNFTRRFLTEKNVTATVEFSWGATEAKVVEGLADAAVEITETGATIKAHGLKIVSDLLHTHTIFIANQQAMADPLKRSKIEQISLMLTSALSARNKVLLKMDVARENLNTVLKLLPSLHAPTIAPLSDPAWSAVETVIDREQVRNLFPKLKASGVKGILETQIQKIC